MMPTKNFRQLYWFMRIGIAVIWLWTAYVSWLVTPHGESLDLLRRVGAGQHAVWMFAASCLLDTAMGIVSLIYARSCIWWLQFVLVASYSVVIAALLPEYLFHPFGEISKNLSVLACLAFLAQADRRP